MLVLAVSISTLPGVATWLYYSSDLSTNHHLLEVGQVLQYKGDVRNAWQFVKEILWEISWLRNFVTSRKEILNPEGEDANSVS